MKDVCPYCKHEITEEPALPPLRPRKRRIYQAVLEAGPAGISPEDLLVRMYGETEWPTPGGPQVMRVMICEMNKALEPYGQRISSRRPFKGCYKLYSLPQPKGLKSNEAKAYSETDH